MDNCTYEDNPEITGRGILFSFYFQGFLMGEQTDCRSFTKVDSFLHIAITIKLLMDSFALTSTN